MLKLFTICALLFFTPFGFYKGEVIKHAVKLKHPGISFTDPVAQTLFQQKGAAGKPDQFYMVVKTVVCGDKHCKIDDVKLYWNELGFYDRLVLPGGVELEKAEGENFSKADYNKLNEILADRNSDLKDVYKEEVVGSETTEGVDAHSGATIILNNNAYVKGAVWTCYTLWHWANGDVHAVIRNLTGDALKLDSLRSFLKNGDNTHKIFALEQISKRKNYDPVTVTFVLKTASANDNDLQQLMLNYLEDAPSNVYYASIMDLLASGDHNMRLLCLNSLLRSKAQPANNYFEQLSDQLSQFNSFQEIDLLLKVFDTKNAGSASVVKNVIPLLNNKNFIIARRVYWFLATKQLTSQQHEKVSVFKAKNADRL